ncbi:hypothetical protein [Viridibacterium curvum]
MSKTLDKFIYAGSIDPTTACSANLYLVDLSFKPPKVISFGVKGACTEFHWASWSKSRSVIAIKKNVKFVYENGKLTPPAKNLQLIKSIEPTHVGEGLDEKALSVFSDELALPEK